MRKLFKWYLLPHMCVFCQIAGAGAAVLLSVIPSIASSTEVVRPASASTSERAIVRQTCKKAGAIRTFQQQKQLCRKTANGLVWLATKKSLPLPTTTTTAVPKPPPTIPTGGSDFAVCKLREARTKNYQPWNVGFPRGMLSGPATLPTSGQANVQLLAIQFPDALGTSTELASADEDIAQFNRWFEFTSNRALSFKWQFPKQWLTMSRPASQYNLVKGDRATVIPMAQEIVSLADPLVDFTDSDFVFVLFPRVIKFGEGIGMANWRVETNEGPVVNLFGGADYFYDRGFDLWSFWIHEWGHPMGLPGHTPRSNISIMDNQNGSSVVLNVWDTFFSGWMSAEELYCMPINEKNQEITLIPLERLQRGPRGVIVPISETNALVIESHRAEGWGKRLLDADYGRRSGSSGTASYGLSVYWVDTTQDTNRYAGSSGYIDTDAGERWGDHIVPNGVSRPFDLLILGDTVTYKGVTVSFKKTGEYDTFQITK